jgi:hypothetical protein
MVGVPFTLPVTVTSNGSPLIAVTVIGLPSGLKYDTMRRVIAGVPLASASNKTVTINARDSAGKSAVPKTFALTVDPLPPWACGTFNGWCGMGSNDAGTATMTVTPQGKVSGKLAVAGSNYTFNAASYAAGSNPSNGFTVFVNTVAGKTVVPVALAVTDPPYGPERLSVARGWLGVSMEGVPSLTMYRNVWSDPDMKSVATNLNGYYTATLPQASALTEESSEFGSGYLAFTLDKGNVKTAGKLADGTAVSLSSVLLVDETNRCFTVLYAVPASHKGGCLAGSVEFMNPGEPGSRVIVKRLGEDPFIWVSRNPQATGEYGSGFMRELDIVGGWYNGLGNLYDYYADKALSVGTADGVTLGTNRNDSVYWSPDDLPLYVITNKLGAVTGISAQKAGVPGKRPDGTYNYEGTTNAVGLTFSLTPKTGIFNGSFKAWFDYPPATHISKPITFEGILTPERENKDDGIEGRGFFLWGDKAPYTNKPGTYPFSWSYDFIVESGP